MENNSFKRINPFRKPDPFEANSDVDNHKRSMFSERKDSKTSPKLFSPPEVGDTELLEEDEETKESGNEDDSKPNERSSVSSFVKEFTSMLNESSLSDSESQEHENAPWHTQGQESLQESSKFEEKTSKNDEWRKRRNPFKDEFTWMLEKDDEIDNSKEDEREYENLSATQSSEKDVSSFVDTFTDMLGFDDSKQENEKIFQHSDEIERKKELHEENTSTEEFLPVLKNDRAEHWEKDANEPASCNNIEQQEEISHVHNTFHHFGEDSYEEEEQNEFHSKNDFISMLEEDFGEEEAEGLTVDENQEIEAYHDYDYPEAIQQEMLSMLEETNESTESSWHFMEDVIEYFDEMEENYSFPLERFLKLLMSIYCFDEEAEWDYDKEEQYSPNNDDLDVTDQEDLYREETSVQVKLPVTLANLNVEVNILETIDLYSQIADIQSVTWSVGSLQSTVLIPSSTVFITGVFQVKIEFDRASSIQSIRIPIQWEKSVDVSWLVFPVLAEEYENEYTFEEDDLVTHYESYKKPALPIDHELKENQFIWNYDLESSTQPNLLHLNGTATLCISLTQPQYFWI